MSETPDQLVERALDKALRKMGLPKSGLRWDVMLEFAAQVREPMESQLTSTIRERDEARAERDLALAAMKRLPEHLKECQGNGDDDPPCVALLAYEEAVQREAALREALEEAAKLAEKMYKGGQIGSAIRSLLDPRGELSEGDKHEKAE